MFHHLLHSHHQSVKILKELVLHNETKLQYTAQISTLQKVYTMEAEKVKVYKQIILKKKLCTLCIIRVIM